MNYRILLFLFLTFSLQAHSQTNRHELPFDDQWKFHLGDVKDVDRRWEKLAARRDLALIGFTSRQHGRGNGELRYALKYIFGCV